MTAFREEPAAANDWLLDHLRLLDVSLRGLTGRHLLAADLPPIEAARQVYESADFVLLSHDTAEDPVFNYANRTAQRRFGMDWARFTELPSRFSAEAPNREARAELLSRVREHGFIDDYRGVRIAADGRRFEIEQALVWNLYDAEGLYRGQAAMFDRWRELD